RVLGVGERLRLAEVGLDAREYLAALHDVAVAAHDLDDLAGDRGFDLDLHFRLDRPDFGDLDLNVGHFRLGRLDRRFRDLLVFPVRLHRHRAGNGHDENDDRDDRNLAFPLRAHVPNLQVFWRLYSYGAGNSCRLGCYKWGCAT